MDDDRVVSLDDRRRPVEPPPPRRFTLDISVAQLPNAKPEVTLTFPAEGGLDLDEVVGLLWYAAISLGNVVKLAGEQEAPVAGLMVYRSGRVRVMAECQEFTAPAQRRWLERILERAGPAFEELFAGAVDPGPSRDSA